MRNQIAVSASYTEAAASLFAVKFLLSAAGAKTFATQNGSSAGGFKGHGIRFTALIAGDLKALALAASSTAATRAAKVCAARITARFAALWLAQVALVIILLLAFGERKGRVAFGTGNLNVWHRYFLPQPQQYPRSIAAAAFPLERPALMFSTATLRPALR